MSRNRWYWTLQLIGWFLYGVLGFSISSAFMGFRWDMLAFQLIACVAMFFASHGFRYLIKGQGWLKLKASSLLLRISLLLVLSAPLVNGLVTTLGSFVTDQISLENYTFGYFALYSFQTLIFFLIWMGCYLGIYYFRNYKQEEISKWQLQASLKDAELIALKAQINPHFLFNALNNIRALILEDQIKAREMVSYLSELLRYSIQFSDQEKVTIAEELEIVEKYLELEKIHYEQRLNYEFKITDSILKCRIPPMTIQLLVENAIKHGISQVKDGGEIVIAIEQNAPDFVSIEVANTGALGSTSVAGIGIKNATERIRLLFEKDPDFELIQEDEQVKSRLKIPIDV